MGPYLRFMLLKSRAAATQVSYVLRSTIKQFNM